MLTVSHRFLGCCLLLVRLSCNIDVALGQVSILSSTGIQQQLDMFSTDALGVQATQALYDGAVESSSSSLDGTTIARTLANQASQRLTARLDMVRSLSAKARAAYLGGQTSSTLTQCCRLSSSSVRFDPRFNQTVDIANGCDRVSSTALPQRATISSVITGEARSQLASFPEAKFQYFGSEQGYSTIYPGINVSDCSSYDPRYRPWYVAAAVPTPKDVVIVIDVSGSMSATVPNSGTRSRLDLAKVAVNSILTTLSDNDRVSVVPFSTNVKPISGSGAPLCFNAELSVVTPYSIRSLQDQVDRLFPDSATIYSRAMTAAYDRFANAPTLDGKRERVILFLTDGAPGESAELILSAQQKGAAMFNYEIAVLTYALGGATSTGEAILRSMAAQVYMGVTLPSGAPIGLYQEILDFNNLRSSLSLYYSYFATEAALGASVVTMPYYDAFGLGAILTAASTVYSGPVSALQLVGVAGVDITVSDLFGDISYFSDTEHQFAFMINDDGEAVLHPLLTLPVDLSSDPLFQDITLLEPDAAFRSMVYWQMRNRTTGTATFIATRFQTVGNSLYEGTRSVRVMSSYHWIPIAGTMFSLCVVLNLEATNEVSRLTMQGTFAASTLYHRLDLRSSGQQCSQYGHLAVRDRSVVKFSPEAFLSPSRYLNIPETTSSLQAYTLYLDSATNTLVNNYFKSSVRDSVRLTSGLDNIWERSSADQYKRSVVWRYIGAIDGVFRIIPGTQLPTAYDHLRRDWFTRSMSNPGQLTFSAPYLDAFGAGYVATMSTTIRQSTNSSSTSSVGAVMGVDFTVGFLGLMLEQTYRQCISQYRCILLDNSGYLVYHPDFVTSGSSPEWVHLGRKEPYLMDDLITRGFAQKISCAKYDTLTRHVTYRITMRFAVTGSYSCSSSVFYKVEPIADTNIFIAFLSTSACSARVDNICTCPQANGLGTCTRSTLCECPCTRPLTYDACENSFPSTSLQYDVCPADIAGIPVVPRQPSATRGLESCFNGTCSAVTDARDCRATQGCAWCTRDSSGSELSSSFCTTDCLCFGGMQGVENPAGDCAVAQQETEESKSGISTGAIVGIIVGVLVVTVVVLILAKKSCTSEASTSTPVVAVSVTPHQPAAATATTAPVRRPSAPTDYSYAPQPATNPNAGGGLPDYNAAVHLGSDFQGAGYSASAAPYPPAASAAPYPPHASAAPYPQSSGYPASSVPYPSHEAPYPTKPPY